MSTRAVLLSLAIAAIAASGVVIAQCRKSERTIATLTEIKKGSADKSTDESKTWKPVEAGERFVTGDAVRTSETGAATLAFGGGMVLGLGSSTTVRFLGKLLSIDGEITNDSDKELVLALEEGVSRIGPRSTVKFSIGDKGNRSITLLVGEATFQAPGGEIQALTQNTILVISEVIDGVTVDAGPTVVDAAPPIDAFIPKSGTVKAVVKGRVKVTAPGAERPQNLRAGEHELTPGSAISLRRGSSITLSREGEEATLRGTGEGVVAPDDGTNALLDAKSGNVRVTATGGTTLIKVPGGRVVGRAGRGRGDIAIGRRSSKITPRSGLIEVTGGGARETIQIGEWIQLSSRGKMQVYGRQPKFADFSIAAGESAAIHDPGAPTAVRVRFGENCANEGGVVEYGTGRAKRLAPGKDSSILLLKPGSYRYALKCLVDGVPGKSTTSGRLRVDRRTGTKPLPTKTTTNKVAADGLSYRVQYQNLIPNIKFHWPNAPAGRYKLMLKSQAGGAKAYNTKGPEHLVRGGALREGTYRFWFEGNGSRSKEGVMIIAFDNAATSGYLRTPRIGARWGGGRIEVVGAGIKGSRVSVGGTSLPLDRQHRFNATVNKPGSQAALAVKFVHPLRGVHYYIRRNGRR